MSHKSSFASFCKDVLTVTSLSVVAVMSIPSDVFSLTTEIANLQQDKTLEKSGLDTKLTNKSSGEELNFLIAKKDKDDHHDHKDDHHDHKDNDDRSSKHYKVKDWDCFFNLGRLVNPNQKALVIHLEIVEKPATKYANVVYTVYTRKNNRWILVYNTTGSKKIEKKGKKYFVSPEVIEFRKLRAGNDNFEKSEVKIVTEIRYDSKKQREEKLVFEDVWNYSYIREVSSVRQLTVERTVTRTNR
ncbi:hypothetical protein [Anabaena sp. PCC 7108]|uniref:hypothetical protein n=1 Tax=Anabaena sp. PCC 7108 TaxID=163908 RepID=UPI00034950CC|nr:hypothetical protein [Anabaena sp. PCC 7108]